MAFKNISIDLLENGSYQVSVTKTFDPEHGGGEQTFMENGGSNPHRALEVAKQMVTVSPSTRQGDAYPPAAPETLAHPYNDLSGNGYCFDCGLGESHANHTKPYNTRVS